MKRILLYTLLITFAGAAVAHADTRMIYTWGYGDLMRETLYAAKMLLGSNNFIDLFKYVALASFVAVLLSIISMQFVGKGGADVFYALMRYYIIAGFIWSIGVVTHVDVAIEDPQRPSFNTVVQDVPWIVAVPVSTISVIQREVGKVMELAYSTPDAMNYSNTGIIGGQDIMYRAMTSRIADPYLNMSLNRYIVECVFPDILSGYKNQTLMMMSDEFWAELGDTNPARMTVVYTQADRQGVMMNCLNAYNNLTGRMSSYASGQALDIISQGVVGFSSATIDSILGQSSQWMMDYSTTGSSMLLNTVSMNHMNEAFMKWGAANGVSGEGLAYAAGFAEENARARAAVNGVMAARFVPAMRALITVLYTGLIPMLMLLWITPLGGKSFMSFVIIGLTLVLWQVGDTILNHVINILTQSSLTAAVDAAGGITYISKPFIESQLLDKVNLAYGMYWAVPMLAFAAASGSAFGMVQAINAMTSNASAGVASGATQLAGGNMSYGNVSVGNTGMHATNAAARGSYGMDNALLNRSSYDAGHTRNSSTTQTGQQFVPEHGIGINDDLKGMGGNFHGLSETTGIGSFTGKTESLGGGMTRYSGGVMNFNDADGKSWQMEIGGSVVTQRNSDGTMTMVSMDNVDIMGRKDNNTGNNVSIDSMKNGTILSGSAVNSDGEKFTISSPGIVKKEWESSDGTLFTANYGGDTLNSLRFTTTKDMQIGDHMVQKGATVRLNAEDGKLDVQGNIDGRNAALVMDNANVNFGAGGNVSSITGNQVNFTGESGSSVTENDDVYTHRGGGKFAGITQSLLKDDKVLDWYMDAWRKAEANPEDTAAQRDLERREYSIVQAIESDVRHEGSASHDQSSVYDKAVRAYASAGTSISASSPGGVPFVPKVSGEAKAGIEANTSHQGRDSQSVSVNEVTNNLHGAFDRAQDFADRNYGDAPNVRSSKEMEFRMHLRDELLSSIDSVKSMNPADMPSAKLKVDRDGVLDHLKRNKE